MNKKILTISEIVDIVKPLAKKYNICEVYIFGSYARGDYSPESDLDIMLLMNCGHSDVKKFQGVVCKIASRIGLEDDIEVSMTMQDKNTFERRLAILPFYRNVKKEGVTLYES